MPPDAADLSQSVHGQDVLHSQDTAQIFLDGGFAVGRLVVLGAGGQPGQHLPVLWAVDVLWWRRDAAFTAALRCAKETERRRGGGATHARDVGNYLEGDAAAGDVAALRHPLQQALGETLAPQSKRHTPSPSHHASGPTDLSPGDADADALPQDELHVGGVAQLDRRLDRQVHPLVSRRGSAQLGTLVDRRVPRSLHLHLNTWNAGTR